MPIAKYEIGDIIKAKNPHKSLFGDSEAEVVALVKRPFDSLEFLVVYVPGEKHGHDGNTNREWILQGEPKTEFPRSHWFVEAKEIKRV